MNAPLKVGGARAVPSAFESSRTRTIYRPFFKTIDRKLGLIREARSWLRTPFRDHWAMKGVGCDCVGFAHAVFVSVRAIPPIQFPAYALDEGSHSNQSKLERVLIECGSFAEVWHRDGSTELPPLIHGDLLGFHLGRSVHHMGLLLGAPQFIHALQNYGVIESTISDPTYRRALASVWRCMEQLERYDDFTRTPEVHP
jgi:cell wall-associated NlpC family hydrolase